MSLGARSTSGGRRNVAGSGQGLGILYFHRVGTDLAQGTRLPHPPPRHPAGSAAGPVRSAKAAGLGPCAAPVRLLPVPPSDPSPSAPPSGAPRPLGLVHVSDYEAHPFLDHTCPCVWRRSVNTRFTSATPSRWKDEEVKTMSAPCEQRPPLTRVSQSRSDAHVCAGTPSTHSCGGTHSASPVSPAPATCPS